MWGASGEARRRWLAPARLAAIAATFSVMAAAVAAIQHGDSASPSSCASVPIESRVPGCTPMNQVQVVGTHNSYHVAVDGRGVSHPALTVQLDAGVRQLELDVHADAAGRTFSVFHAAPYDTGTRCRALRSCLREIARWSAAHPSHVPVMVLLEVKDSRVGGAELDGLDGAVRSAFSRRAVLQPDDVRAGSATLAAAVRTRGWPTLAAVRGRVLFVLDNGGGVRETYLSGHASLRGRVMFTNAPAGAEDEAITEINEPIDGGTTIRQLVGAGVMVRTRADTGQTAVDDLGTRHRAALMSGAQWVSTDYSAADTGSAPTVRFLAPHAVAQIDPLFHTPALIAAHRA